jgi:hypothetical protein
LGVAVGEDAGRVRIDANQLLADSMRGVNAAEQLLEFVVGDCLLKFRQRFPVWRVCDRSAEVIGGESGRRKEEEKEPKIATAKDHGLEFRLFNTMLGEC